MTNKPIQSFRRNGVEIAYWGFNRFSVQKRYKKKDSDSWLSTNNYFRNELEKLGELISEVLRSTTKEADKPRTELISQQQGAGETDPQPKLWANDFPSDSEAPPFEDDDIPF